jgi:two-component system, LytTR family, response regulator
MSDMTRVNGTGGTGNAGGATASTISLRALVLDDEFAGRQRMLDMLRERQNVEVVAVCEDLSQARQAIAQGGIDVAFLDIRLPEGDGFDVLADLPESDRPVVIFATAYDDHAVRAFAESAADYLLKPVDEDRLDEALGRASAAVERRRGDALVGRLGDLIDRASRRDTAPTAPGAAATDARIAVRSAGRVTFVKPADIDWLDAAGNSVRIHAAGEVYRLRDTLSRFERSLDAQRFARIHRSTIVNLDRVREILVSPHGDYVVVLEGGQRLTVGRLHRERIQSMVASFAD